MSSAYAVAAVSAVLRDLLNAGLVSNDVPATVGTVSVTARAPDMITTGADEAPQLNLFLHRVGPNQGWRNVGQPQRDADGLRTSNPPLALNLYYLLSAYGGDDFVREILLGHGMQVLHETPGLGRDAIRDALGSLPAGLATLAASELAEQVEAIKLTMEPMSSEEVGRLWSAFDSPYRPSASYCASVVLIETRRSTRSALPVLRYYGYALPLPRPNIVAVAPDVPPGGDPRITTASTLVLTGADLRGPVTHVRVGAILVPDPSLTLAQNRISFPLNSVTGLRAGIQGVQVVHEVLMGEPLPGVPHRGVESNVAAFVLHPVITVPASVAGPAGTLTVGFAPAVGRTQRVTLYLYERNAPEGRPARAYSFEAPRDNGIVGPGTETAAIQFEYAGVEADDYLAFVQVDGADSALGVDGAGQLATPTVQVT